MYRIRERRPSGINGSMLKVLGLIVAALGIIGRGVFQYSLLGIEPTTTNDQIMQLLSATNTAMNYAALAIGLQILETCAVPIFAFALLEGFKYTSDFKKYFLRMLGLAVVSEIPYNFAIGGKLLDISTRNPVFGLVLCLIVLYFYRRYAEKGFQNTVIKLVVTVAAFIWAFMLRIDAGGCFILMVSIMWLFRNKPGLRVLSGCSAAFACTLFSPYYIVAAMSFILIHFYNDEKGDGNKIAHYVAYPLILLAVGIVAKFFI